MYDNIIKFISETTTVNEYGDTVATETERTVFAELKSIGQTEFYQAQASGFKPEIKFVLADFCDYQGERNLKYTPYGGSETTYEVIRTYRVDNRLEIVCQRGIE